MTTAPPMWRRPAPQDIGTPTQETAQGAPVVRRGLLLMGYRDATYLKSPNVHGDNQGHAAVFTHEYAVGSGMAGIAAACDPRRILLDDGMLFSPGEIENPHVRCRRGACRSLLHAADRQRSDLEHIRSYYKLEHRIGVRVDLGLRVRHDGRSGTIIDTSGQYVVVRLDDEPVPVTVHATSSMEYEGPDGWVRAVPLPTPYAAV